MKSSILSRTNSKANKHQEAVAEAPREEAITQEEATEVEGAEVVVEEEAEDVAVLDLENGQHVPTIYVCNEPSATTRYGISESARQQRAEMRGCLTSAKTMEDEMTRLRGSKEYGHYLTWTLRHTISPSVFEGPVMLKSHHKGIP